MIVPDKIIVEDLKQNSRFKKISEIFEQLFMLKLKMLRMKMFLVPWCIIQLLTMDSAQLTGLPIIRRGAVPHFGLYSMNYNKSAVSYSC